MENDDRITKEDVIELKDDIKEGLKEFKLSNLFKKKEYTFSDAYNEVKKFLIRAYLIIGVFIYIECASFGPKGALSGLGHLFMLVFYTLFWLPIAIIDFVVKLLM